MHWMGCTLLRIASSQSEQIQRNRRRGYRSMTGGAFIPFITLVNFFIHTLTASKLDPNDASKLNSKYSSLSMKFDIILVQDI